MYKSYFETVLNNSYSTKQYQLKMNGYFGDSGNKDINVIGIINDIYYIYYTVTFHFWYFTYLVGNRM